MVEATRRVGAVRRRVLSGLALLLGLAVPSVGVPAGAQAGGQGDAAWTYNPDVGLEGLAQVSDGKSHRLEVECGNGGGPGITLFSPAVTEGLLAGKKEVLLLDLAVDGTVFTEAYSCYPGQTFCVSEGFPSHALIEAMRQGAGLRISLDGADLAAFSLKGSDAAIAPLTYCLGPDAY